MSNDAEIVQISLDGPDGDDVVSLPVGLVDLLAEEGQSTAEVVGDLALFGCAQRIHATVHHGEGTPDDDLVALETTTLDLFEDRFGVSYGAATGHQH